MTTMDSDEGSGADRPADRSLSFEGARRWYNAELAKASPLDKAWEDAGVSLEERARRLQDVRHRARLDSRDMMKSRLGVRWLQFRDWRKYRNKDGPTFGGMVRRRQKAGLSGDKLYQSIIDSYDKTDPKTNKKYDPETADKRGGGSGKVDTGKPVPGEKQKRPGEKGKPNAGRSGAAIKAIKAKVTALKGKATALRDSIKAMTDRGVAHAKMVGGWAKAPKGLTNLTKAMKNSSTAQKNVQGATKSWIGAHGKINASMMKSPLGMIALGITALIGVVTLIIGNWGTIEKVFEAVRKNTLEPVGKFFQDVFASATAGLSNVTKGISDSFSGLGSGAEGVFKTVIHYVAVVVNAIGSVLKRLNIPLPDWLGGGSIGYGFIGDAMVEWAVAHMATGGVVRGPGGPRDDQVPIMASNGEFVVNAASTSRHIALLEAINTDSLTISGRDAQVIAVRQGAFAVPSRALPHVVNRHHFDHSTTVNLTTNHLDSAHVRATTLAAQREVAASWA
ncbi:hypothetical protein ACFWFQ_21765 [Nocardia salmonicida]|uniref:hypothetical protein n=1 Tax=Nocardia salmonicida TaxID=53431 RepID=UPI0036665558